uniref:Uncharacterized protein n=1 Tax=Fagus sylvatica TaxID=28930 RepID=A0A2N9J342_FAGSY
MSGQFDPRVMVLTDAYASLGGYRRIRPCIMSCARTSPRRTRSFGLLGDFLRREGGSCCCLASLLVDTVTSFEYYQETFMFPLRKPLPVEGARKDIPLPPWSVTLRCSDGLLVKIAVDRREGAYGLPIPPDFRQATNADLEDIIGLVGSLKILATQ